MPKIVDKSDKRKMIADASLKVFRKRGYPKTRMLDIAREAGIGKGTVYEYFKDKADILRFAFDQYFNIFAQGVYRSIKDQQKPAEKLLSLVDFSLQHAAQWEDHCAIYVDYFGAARTDRGGVFSLSGMYEQMKNILGKLIHEGQVSGEIDGDFDPVVISELLVSIFDGIILHRVFEGQGVDRESLRRATLQFIKNGLSVRTADNHRKRKQ